MDYINYSVQCLSVRGERKMPTKKSKNKNYFIKSLPFMVQFLVIWDKRLICGPGFLGRGTLLLRRKHSPFVVLRVET